MDTSIDLDGPAISYVNLAHQYLIICTLIKTAYFMEKCILAMQILGNNFC